MPECFVAKAADLKDGDRCIVVAGPQEIGVFYKDGAYYAYSNYCAHSGGAACEGLMINRVKDVIAPDRTYQGQVFGEGRDPADVVVGLSVPGLRPAERDPRPAFPHRERPAQHPGRHGGEGVRARHQAGKADSIGDARAPIEMADRLEGG